MFDQQKSILVGGPFKTNWHWVTDFTAVLSSLQDLPVGREAEINDATTELQSSTPALPD